ncbi:MAG: serine/threonine-protein kinase [Gemmatimonadetes bacterium]|nr:serine/threonine-protein kinase [Gemmatimonadota bacterium]
MKDPLDQIRDALRGRYDVERLLGKGGMATVFLGVDRSSNAQVALKVLSLGVATRIMKERFHRELGVGTKLAHPHIVPIVDGGEIDGLPFLVMPYLSEGSLHQRLAGARLEIGEALQIGREIGDALAYAHELGIIHRDIKPDNVLFSEGRALVSDFGVAVAISASLDDRLTVPGEVLGTPTYMSPEQAIGRYQLDARTDQYSLACVICEMLTGEPPFRPANPEAIIVRRFTDDAPDMCALRPDVGRSVADALRTALEWKPDRRFGSIAEFRDALITD